MKISKVLFRVYDKTKNEYEVLGNEVYNKDEGDVRFFISNDGKLFKIDSDTKALTSLEDDNIEIEFWTGFKDINNNKIFEGDIVEIDNAKMTVVNTENGYMLAHNNRLYFIKEDNNVQNKLIVSNIHNVKIK